MITFEENCFKAEAYLAQLQRMPHYKMSLRVSPSYTTRLISPQHQSASGFITHKNMRVTEQRLPPPLLAQD